MGTVLEDGTRMHNFKSAQRCTKTRILPPSQTQNRPQPPLPLRQRPQIQALLPGQIPRRRCLTRSVALAILSPVSLRLGSDHILRGHLHNFGADGERRGGGGAGSIQHMQGFGAGDQLEILDDFSLR